MPTGALPAILPLAGCCHRHDGGVVGKGSGRFADPMHRQSRVQTRMSIEKTIAGIPTMSPKARETLRANAERLLRTPGREPDARRVLDALEAAAQGERAALIAQAQSLPKAQKVVQAFTVMPMTETERKVVQALLDNPGASSRELSQSIGWDGQAWDAHFGRMCGDREHLLWPAEPYEKIEGRFLSGILADISTDLRWTMNPEVVEGPAALGLRPRRREPA